MLIKYESVANIFNENLHKSQFWAFSSMSHYFWTWSITRKYFEVLDDYVAVICRLIKIYVNIFSYVCRVKTCYTAVIKSIMNVHNFENFSIRIIEKSITTIIWLKWALTLISMGLIWEAQQAPLHFPEICLCPPISIYYAHINMFYPDQKFCIYCSITITLLAIISNF